MWLAAALEPSWGLCTQRDDGREVEPELLRLRDGHDTDRALSDQLAEAPADGAFADVEGPGYARVRRTAVLLKDLNDGPIELIRNSLLCAKLILTLRGRGFGAHRPKE